MTLCAVPGCNSSSSLPSNITFHRLPDTPLYRARWVIALGRLPQGCYVCSLHFDASMFRKPGLLVRNAVPKPNLVTPPNKEQSPHLGKFSDQEEWSDEVIACRVCLAVEGRLYVISGSGLEDALAALTGVELSSEENLPRHLCAFCLAKLSKYAAFHEDCQRSTALLEALLKRGPINMNIIKAYSKKSQELINNLSMKKVFQFGTTPVLEITPLITTENNENNECSQEETEFTEVEYLESEDFMENNEMDAESLTFELPTKIKNVVTENPKIKIVNVEARDNNAHPNVNDCIESKENSYASDADMVTAEDATAPLKTDYDLAFEKEFNFEITMLSKVEQKQQIEERKLNSTSAFSCDLCGKGFVEESSLTQHKNYFHDPSLPLACGVCLHRFRSRRGLRAHRQGRHRALYACRECGRVCLNRKNARDHYRMHKGRTYACPYCRKEFDSSSAYYFHVRTRHPGESESEVCDECGETFTGRVGLMVHKRMRHRPNEHLKCAVCEVAFLSAEALQRHQKLSAGVPHAALWACAACGESCGSEPALAAHAAERHPPEQRHCKKCNKTFSSAASYALHARRMHSARPKMHQRRLVCEMCGKMFSCQATLQYHMNGHLGLKPFQCPHCPKAFENKLNLHMHMRVHTGEKPYQCDQCPLSFANRGNFTRHIRNIHLRVQGKCELCGKTMSASSIYSHVRAVHMKLPFVRRKRNRTNKTRIRVTES